MTTQINNPAIYTDFNGLARLKTKAQQPDEATLREVARQFEAMFFEMLLKGMREAKIGEGMFDSQEGELYHDLFDKQISLDLAKQQGIGLADQLVRQLKGTLRTEGEPTSPAAEAAPLAGPGVPRRGNAAVSPVSAREDWRPADKVEFVRDVLPHAQRAARALGVPTETLVAQAALESGWGQGVLRGGDGHPSFNIFNIKADPAWHGERVTQTALEHEGGVLRRVPSAFRSYTDLKSAFEDYVAFVQGNPRYAQALEVQGDGRAYITELHRAGYATDPQYANKIAQIMDSASFSETLDRARQGDVQGQTQMRAL